MAALSQLSYSPRSAISYRLLRGALGRSRPGISQTLDAKGVHGKVCRATFSCGSGWRRVRLHGPRPGHGRATARSASWDELRDVEVIARATLLARVARWCGAGLALALARFTGTLIAPSALPWSSLVEASDHAAVGQAHVADQALCVFVE
jgi:hypothetical protein